MTTYLLVHIKDRDGTLEGPSRLAYHPDKGAAEFHTDYQEASDNEDTIRFSPGIFADDFEEDFFEPRDWSLSNVLDRMREDGGWSILPVPFQEVTIINQA